MTCLFLPEPESAQCAAGMAWHRLSAAPNQCVVVGGRNGCPSPRHHNNSSPALPTIAGARSLSTDADTATESWRFLTIRSYSAGSVCRKNATQSSYTVTVPSEEMSIFWPSCTALRKSRPSWSMVTILVSFQMSARMMPGADTESMCSA